MPRDIVQHNTERTIQSNQRMNYNFQINNQTSTINYLTSTMRQPSFNELSSQTKISKMKMKMKINKKIKRHHRNRESVEKIKKSRLLFQKLKKHI